MKLKNIISISLISLSLASGLLLGCGEATSDNVSVEATPSATQEATGASDTSSAISDNPEANEEAPKEAADAAGSRDNTPLVLVPKADGATVYGNSTATIDASHSYDGYVMVDYEGSNEMPKLQIIGPMGLTYNYDLHGGYETFNFTQGDGTYQIGVYECIDGHSKYSQLTICSVDVKIDNEFSPYLYPNQYVDFNENSNVVAFGAELAKPANSDLDVISNVYNYVISNISYDSELATTVESTYLPDPDRTLEIKTGICFDYAAIMAAMLRSQQIPTRLQIGYAGDAYHAWISTYIEGKGWVNGIVEFHGDTWELMDPTLASNRSERELRSFIGDGSGYVVCYEY